MQLKQRSGGLHQELHRIEHAVRVLLALYGLLYERGALRRQKLIASGRNVKNGPSVALPYNNAPVCGCWRRLFLFTRS